MVKRRTRKHGGKVEKTKSKFPSNKEEFLLILQNDKHLEKEFNVALKKAKNSKIKIKLPDNFDEILENIKKNKNVDIILKEIGSVYSKIIKQRKRRVKKNKNKKKILRGGDGDDDDEGDGAEKNGGDDDDDDDSNIDYENLDIGGPDSQVCYRAAFTKWALLVAGGTAVGGALIYAYMTLPSTASAISATALAQLTGSTITSVRGLADNVGIDTEPERAAAGLGVAAILAYLAASKEVFKPIIDSISSILGGGRDGSLLFITYLIVNDYCKCMREKQRSLEPEGREDYRNKCDEKKNFINEVYHIYAIIADLLPGFSPIPKEFRQRKIPNIIRIIQQRLGTTVHPPLEPEGDNVLGGMEVDNRGVAITQLVAREEGGLAPIPTEAQISRQMGRDERRTAAEGRRGLRRRRPVNNNNNNNQPQRTQMLRQRSANPQEQAEQKRAPTEARRMKSHDAGGGRRKTKRRRKVKKTKKRKMKKRKRKTNKKRRRRTRRK